MSGSTRWLGIAVCLWSGVAAAADQPAAEIARLSRERGSLNLVDLQAELKLTTTAKGGAAREQTLRSTARRIGGRLHSISRFVAPAGVAGTAVLTIEATASEPSAISIYFPKLRRVRKVAPGQRGEAFMQTDFSFADLGGTGNVRDDLMKRQPDEVVEGRKTFVLSGSPGADSPYGEVRVWVDQETYVPLRASYSDKEGKPLKQYRALKLKKFEDRVFATEAVMENVQTGSVTRLEVLKLERSTAGDDAFTERALERG